MPEQQLKGTPVGQSLHVHDSPTSQTRSLSHIVGIVVVVVVVVIPEMVVVVVPIIVVVVVVPITVVVVVAGIVVVVVVGLVDTVRSLLWVNPDLYVANS